MKNIKLSSRLSFLRWPAITVIYPFLAVTLLCLIGDEWGNIFGELNFLRHLFVFSICVIPGTIAVIKILVPTKLKRWTVNLIGLLYSGVMWGLINWFAVLVFHGH